MAIKAGFIGTLVAALLAAGSVAALATDGNATGPLFASSYAHERQGQIKAALADMTTVLQRDDGHYVATLRAGWLSYTAGDYTAAARYYQAAIKLAPEAIEPRLGLMLPLMALGQWSAAEAVGNEIVQRDPRSYLARSRLAYVYFSQGRYSLAEKTYDAVLDDYPSDLDMMLGLAWTQARQGRTGQASASFARVLALQPDNASAQKGLESLGTRSASSR
jgi:tetratricopeptide (TPR) repeat protein